METAAKEAAKDRAFERELTRELVRHDRNPVVETKTKHKVIFPGNLLVVVCSRIKDDSVSVTSTSLPSNFIFITTHDTLVHINRAANSSKQTTS